jgi:hypothetical protein
MAALPRARRLVQAAGVVLVAALGAALWAALAPLPAGPREVVYVIPKGAAARQAAGATAPTLPSSMRFTLGVRDVLVLRNEDDAPATFGPVVLAPGQTYRVPFREPARFQLACSLHPDGQIAIVVEPAPAPGWRRLLWRLGA